MNVAVYFSDARNLQINKAIRPAMPTISKVHPRTGHEGPEGAQFFISWDKFNLVPGCHGASSLIITHTQAAYISLTLRKDYYYYFFFLFFFLLYFTAL